MKNSYYKSCVIFGRKVNILAEIMLGVDCYGRTPRKWCRHWYILPSVSFAVYPRYYNKCRVAISVAFLCYSFFITIHGRA